MLQVAWAIYCVRYDKNRFRLITKQGKILQLKPFVQKADASNDGEAATENEMDDDEFIDEFVVKEEKHAKNIKQNSQIMNVEKPPDALNYWDQLPDEMVEKILLESILSSDHMCLAYNNIFLYGFFI